MSTIQFRITKDDDTGQQGLVAFVDGRLTDPIDDTHPNFAQIVEVCKSSLDGETVDPAAFIDLFDVAKAVERKFQQLGERVSVRGNSILFDGDPVEGPLEDQILSFLNEGQDFAPLVKFYENLATNPLGNVREGLFSWIKGQVAEGNFTIDTDGNILGYKSVRPTTPEWRKDVGERVYIPSQPSRHADIVGGLEVPRGSFIEQVVGDTVEMPRSKVLNAPSQACGDGLHIGTWAYAKDFYGGSVVMLVKFSPRDIVSLPDSNSMGKLRVSRYTIIDIVDAPLETVLYNDTKDVVAVAGPDVGLSVDGWDDIDVDDIEVGDTIIDYDGDEGVVTEIVDDELSVDYTGNTNSSYRCDGASVEQEDVVTVRRKKTYSGATS